MGCSEMNVSQALSDPLIASVMTADAVDRAELEAMFDAIARTLRARQAAVPLVPEIARASSSLWPVRALEACMTACCSPA